ncbi:MAG: hypothetical protein ACI4XA_09970 [Oscillospiraceae bacterium]
MKIGRYPVKKTYSIPRAIADAASALILFVLVRTTLSFFDECSTIYSYAAVHSSELEALQRNKYLALIPVVLALAATVFTVIFVLVSHREPKNITLDKKTAQRYYVILADAATLIRIPVLLAFVEISYYIQQAMLMREVSYFSIQFICDILIALIIWRFTLHRLGGLAQRAPAEKTAENVVKVKAVGRGNAPEKTAVEISPDKSEANGAGSPEMPENTEITENSDETEGE